MKKKNPKKKFRIGTLNVVLVCVFAYMIYLNWQMLQVFKMTGAAPESAWCALIAALIGECGICGWIKTNKDRRQERKWQKQDEKEYTAMNPDAGVDTEENMGEENL